MSGFARGWTTWTCAFILAILGTIATLQKIAWSANNVPKKDIQPTAIIALDRFDDPEQIAAHFNAELGKLFKSQKLPTPQDLAKQSLTGKTCRIEILTDPGQKLNAESVYEKARRSVVIVGGINPGEDNQQWEGAFASGFVIHRDGIIVTNAHVMEAFQDSAAVGVMTDDGRVFSVKDVLACDRENDVAVLKVDADNLAPLPLAATAPVGSTVYCLSHPILNCDGTENGFYAFTQGIISGKYHARLDTDKPVNTIAITADYAEGSSGGPILNEHGAVVGIVCQTASLCGDGNGGNVQMTWKFARPSSSILALLKGEPVKPPKAEARNLSVKKETK